LSCCAQSAHVPGVATALGLLPAKPAMAGAAGLPESRGLSKLMKTMPLRLANPGDIVAILALERAAAAREFVGQWSSERHSATLASPDARYFVSESSEGEIDAYAILRGLSESSGAVELKRIVVARPGQGLGRRILSALIRIAFEDLRAHRLFLDVFEDNARARHLYESLGFVYEGVLREAAQRDGAYVNLHLMSILVHEYTLRQSART
jgi:diamine N-acetyltransferase